MARDEVIGGLKAGGDGVWNVWEEGGNVATQKIQSAW